MKQQSLMLWMLALVALSAGWLAPSPAQAQIENIWQGITPDWNDGINWSLGMVPGPGEIAVFQDGNPGMSFEVVVSQPTIADMVSFRNNGMDYVFTAFTDFPTMQPAFQANSLTLEGQASVIFENPSPIPGMMSFTQFNMINILTGSLLTGPSGNLVVPPSGQTSIAHDGVLLLTGEISRLESMVFNAGMLGGNGTVQGPVVNSGMIAPGLSPGTLTIDGSFMQTNEGRLQMEIELSDLFDLLVITGDADLAGAVEIMVGPATSDPLVPIITIGGDREGVFRPVRTLGSSDIFYTLDYVDTNSTDVFGYGYFEGDMNLSGGPPDELDIPEFVRALRNRDAYWNEWVTEGDISGDIDDVNGLTFDDVDDFLALLPPGSGAQLYRLLAGVPEPASLWLFLGMMLGLVSVRRRS